MKPKIVSLRNDEDFSRIVFKKSQELMIVFSKFLHYLGVDPLDVNRMMFNIGMCAAEEKLEEFRQKGSEPEIADINMIVDEIFGFDEKGAKVNIIFGKGKVFLLAKLSEEKKEILSKMIINECEIVHPE